MHSFIHSLYFKTTHQVAALDGPLSRNLPDNTEIDLQTIEFLLLLTYLLTVFTR